MEQTFKELHLTLADREVTIFCPEEGKANGRWALKTEYLPAFPDVQNRLVELGYHLAHIKNRTRWGRDEDVEAQGILAEYMHRELGLSQKCVPIGMSCGGLQAIYFAERFPQYVSCMYLDAPVVNLLSAPGCYGKRTESCWEEFAAATGLNRITILSYRRHPMDRLGPLMAHNIPIILVSGDCDELAPYDENGEILDRMYREHGCTIETIIKPGCGHHPHGLEDNTPIINFILKYDHD